MTQLEDFYKDWIQCENYDVLNKLRVCKVLDQVYGISDRLGILVFMEQWLPHLFVLFFIVSISFMLFASLTEEQMVNGFFHSFQRFLYGFSSSVLKKYVLELVVTGTIFSPLSTPFDYHKNSLNETSALR